MGSYARPSTIEEALALRASGAMVLAGGTDIYPAAAAEPWRLSRGPIVDLTACAALRGIAHRDGAWTIGAATTWATIRDAALPPALAALQEAAREIGGRQIQSRATIAGNLVNASPAADAIPALMVLDAAVVLASRRGTRALSIDQFVTGPRRTALADDEIVTGVVIPDAAARTVRRSRFLKLGARRYLVISIVMAAGSLEVAEGRVANARIAVGAASAIACRLTGLEQALVGAPLCDCDGLVEPRHLDLLAPLDDVRADAAYRRDAAQALVRRLVRDLAEAP